MKALLLFLVTLTACGRPTQLDRERSFLQNDKGIALTQSVLDAEYFEKNVLLTSKDFFETEVLPLLEKDCKKCHGNPAPDYATAKTKIKPKDADQSILYTKAAGKKHKMIWAIASTELAKMKSWIDLE